MTKKLGPSVSAIALGFNAVALLLAPQIVQARERINHAHQRLCQTVQPIVVAVIDTGLDTNHARFKNHIWTNPGESGPDASGRNKATNQIDDDKNGFIDDVHGWNFAGRSNDLMDRFGHGTHISGLIVGPVRTSDGSNYERGIASIEPDKQKCHPIELMVLKYYERGMLPHATLQASTAAIQYAIKMHARVINFSSGGANPNVNERAAIALANDKHILFVAAAGNDHENDDQDGFYPASYKLPNILSVAASNDQGNRLLDFSNYGRHTVDIAAPGDNLISTLPDGAHGAMSGTSQATAVTTSVVARFLQLHPEITNPTKVIDYIERTATVVANFRNRLVSGGQLNPIVALESMPPGHSQAAHSPR